MRHIYPCVVHKHETFNISEVPILHISALVSEFMHFVTFLFEASPFANANLNKRSKAKSFTKSMLLECSDLSEDC